MNKFVFVAIVALIGICQADEKYTTKYDGIDIQEILHSDRLLNNYFNCLMKEVGCTTDGKELLSVIPDALQTGCSKCSEKQKASTKEIIHFLIENKKDMWSKLEAKFDPQGTYIKKYDAELKKL